MPVQQLPRTRKPDLDGHRIRHEAFEPELRKIPLRLRFDYLVREGTASQRRVEPHRLVYSGRRWYLLAWDGDRGDWRSMGEVVPHWMPFIDAPVLAWGPLLAVFTVAYFIRRGRPHL